MIGSVDVAVERFGGHEVKRVGAVDIIGNLNVEITDAVADRSDVDQGLVLDKLCTGHGIGGVPDVVDFTLNPHLVVPRHAGGTVSEEFSVHVGRLCDPTVERILFDGVGAGVARGIGVDDARFVNGHDAVVGVAKVALRYGNLVGVDALKNARDQQFNIVSQDGRKRLVGTIHAVGFARFRSHIAPTDVGVTRTVLRIWNEFSTEENRLVRWSIVFHNGCGKCVLPDKAQVLVIHA